MDYLHWIGKQHYTQHRFIKEAKKYGVTRRVSLNIAKQMHWDDRVFCAMLDGKTGVLFGYFDIDRISGLSPYASTLVCSSYENSLIDEGGVLILRGCGEYIERATHAVRCELPNIIDVLKEATIDDKDIGQPMIGGCYRTLSKIRLMDIPFRQGFRTLDAQALFHEATRNHMRVYGQFYVDKNEATPLLSDHLSECGWIQAVENYQQKKGSGKKV